MPHQQDIDPHWYTRYPIESAAQWASTHIRYAAKPRKQAKIFRPLIAGAIFSAWSLYFAHGLFFLILEDPLELDPIECIAASALILIGYLWGYFKKTTQKLKFSVENDIEVSSTAHSQALLDANEDATLIWQRYTQFLNEYGTKENHTDSKIEKTNKASPEQRVPNGTMRPSFFRHEVKIDDPPKKP